MTDPAEWLTAQLDTDEKIARSAELHIREHGWHDMYGICSEESTFVFANDPAHVLRTIAAHRAILADLADIEKWVGHPSNDPVTDAAYAATRLGLKHAVRRLVVIYADRPGFDPSWAVS